MRKFGLCGTLGPFCVFRDIFPGGNSWVQKTFSAFFWCQLLYSQSALGGFGECETRTKSQIRSLRGEETCSSVLGPK